VAVKRIKGLETLDSNGHGLVCTITREQFDRDRAAAPVVHHVAHDHSETVGD
jgi:hypothetical protein